MSHNHKQMYEHLGGDSYVKDLTKKNPKMNYKTTQNYVEEVAKSYELSLDNPKAANSMLDKINKKYSNYFKKK